MQGEMPMSDDGVVKDISEGYWAGFDQGVNEGFGDGVKAERERILAILRRWEASDNAFVRRAFEEAVDEIKGGVR